MSCSATLGHVYPLHAFAILASHSDPFDPAKKSCQCHYVAHKLIQFSVLFFSVGVAGVAYGCRHHLNFFEMERLAQIAGTVVCLYSTCVIPGELATRRHKISNMVRLGSEMGVAALCMGLFVILLKTLESPRDQGWRRGDDPTCYIIRPFREDIIAVVSIAAWLIYSYKFKKMRDYWLKEREAEKNAVEQATREQQLAVEREALARKCEKRVRAECNFNRGDYRKALPLFLKYYHDESRPEDYQKLLLCYFYTGDYQAALRMLESPKLGSYTLPIWRVALETGHKIDGVNFLIKLLAETFSESGNPYYCRALAEREARDGKWDVAIQKIEEAMRLLPEDRGLKSRLSAWQERKKTIQTPSQLAVKPIGVEPTSKLAREKNRPPKAFERDKERRAIAFRYRLEAQLQCESCETQLPLEGPETAPLLATAAAPSSAELAAMAAAPLPDDVRVILPRSVPFINGRTHMPKRDVFASTDLFQRACHEAIRERLTIAQQCLHSIKEILAIFPLDPSLPHQNPHLLALGCHLMQCFGALRPTGGGLGKDEFDLLDYVDRHVMRTAPARTIHHNLCHHFPLIKPDALIACATHLLQGNFYKHLEALQTPASPSPFVLSQDFLVTRKVTDEWENQETKGRLIRTLEYIQETLITLAQIFGPRKLPSEHHNLAAATMCFIIVGKFLVAPIFKADALRDILDKRSLNAFTQLKIRILGHSMPVVNTISHLMEEPDDFDMIQHDTLSRLIADIQKNDLLKHLSTVIKTIISS